MEDGKKAVDAALPTAREPYESPSITWEEVLDVHVTLAQSCGKTDGSSDPACNSGSPGS